MHSHVLSHRLTATTQLQMPKQFWQNSEHVSRGKQHACCIDKVLINTTDSGPQSLS